MLEQNDLENKLDVSLSLLFFFSYRVPSHPATTSLGMSFFHDFQIHSRGGHSLSFKMKCQQLTLSRIADKSPNLKLFKINCKSPDPLRIGAFPPSADTVAIRCSATPGLRGICRIYRQPTWLFAESILQATCFCIRVHFCFAHRFPYPGISLALFLLWVIIFLSQACWIVWYLFFWRRRFVFCTLPV